MRIAVFDTHRFDREALERANADFGHALTFFEARLSSETARLGRGFDAVCPFVNDRCDAAVLRELREGGVRLLALRSAGFNHVDLEAAARLGLTVARVPEYSPHAVAEHAVALVLTLVRRIHKAYARTREGNFTLDGLVGFDLCGKTVGIVGTGRIGAAAARAFQGFGCRVVAYDLTPTQPLEYVPLDALWEQSHVVSLHVPLTPETRHLVDARALARMRPGVVLVNTGRGALIDTRALIDALKRGHVGAAGLDVYEEEEAVFFRDLSDQVLQDDVLARLLTFPNVLVTAHQAFLTREALDNIARVTLVNAQRFERGEPLTTEVRAADVLRPRPG